jgi:hypothetical protein
MQTPLHVSRSAVRRRWNRLTFPTANATVGPTIYEAAERDGDVLDDVTGAAKCLAGAKALRVIRIMTRLQSW